MTATHWLALSVVSGLGVLGGAVGFKPTPVAGSPAEQIASADPAEPELVIDSLASRGYAATLNGVQAAHRTVLRNIANAQTPGYRAIRPLFEAWDDDSARTTGVMLPRMEASPQAGWPVDTGRALDVRIDGTGCFQVAAPDAPGGRAYTRVGHLTIDSQGFLAAGLPGRDAKRLEPPVAIPDGAADLRVTTDGLVEAMAPETGDWIPLDALRLVAFPRDGALRPVGDVLHATTEAGRPRIAAPGTPGLGNLRSGSLEGSNVDLATESEQLRHLRAWSERLSEALLQPDPLARVIVASR